MRNSEIWVNCINKDGTETWIFITLKDLEYNKTAYYNVSKIKITLGFTRKLNSTQKKLIITNSPPSSISSFL